MTSETAVSAVTIFGLIVLWAIGRVYKQVVHLKESIMPSMSELKTAVLEAVAKAKADIAAALLKEKNEIVAQIQDLKNQVANGATVSAADFDEIINGVGSIGSGAVADIDKVSDEDGAGTVTGGGNGDPQP